jgi:protocatechuate 3,4-dioxygenase beta subunit
VIDEASGAPVTNAAVSVSGQDAAAAESDDEPGNYLFAGLSREPAAIDVTATGYLPARVSARAGQQEPLTIALKRGHTLRGRIHDENGQPLDRAAISRENDVKAFSDTDGTFELIGLELEEMRIGVSRPGSIGRTIAIAPNQLDGPPLDIELSSGLHVKGRVVAGDGQPVAVRVVAQSAELGAGFVYTSSDAAGRFEITGLAPARYDFTAGNEMTAAYGVVRDVDVEHVREIVLPVTTSETGTVTGRVTGLSPEYVSGTVGAAGYDGEARSLTSDDGTFRLEGVAAGKQTVSALVTNAVGQQRLASVSVDVPAGGETHVEIAFGPQRLVHGRVTRAGTPLSWASISFRGDEQSAIARTDVDGRYEVRLEPVRYAVTVREGGPETFHLTDLPYRGEVDAQQTAFDIAIEEAEVRVHVIDTQTGEPVVEARVQNVDEQVEPFLSPLTGADGIATLQIASGKPAALRIEKEGYGPVFVETAGGDVAVRLAKAAKLVVHVVDARDGRTLVAVVTAFDAKDHVVTHISQPGSDGLATFNLAPGEYHFTAAFDGFEIGTARVAVPSSGEVRIALRRKAG